MKIALVFPRIAKGWWSPPLFAGYIGAVLENAGHEVHLIDLTFQTKESAWEYLRMKLSLLQPDYIGIHSQTLSYQNVENAVEVSRKTCPNIPLVIGGPHACIEPKNTLIDTGADYIVVGEGEYSMLEIIEGKHSKGIVEAKPIEHLDNLPFPARHLFDKRYFDHYAITIMGSRGCPYTCLTKDARITLSTGEKKLITDLSINDILLAYDTSHCKQVNSKVLALHKTKGAIIEIDTLDGHQLRITPEHPVFTKRGWVNVEDLTLEDEVLICP